MFPFLKLPRELRDQVYHYALNLPANRVTSQEGYSNYEIQPGWLLLNRQIHQEATRVFRKNTFVALLTPWAQSYGHIAHHGFVPLLAVDKQGEDFQNVHMEIKIDSPSIAEQSHSFERFIILLEDLKTFCDFWFYSNLGYPGLNDHLNLTLTLKDPYSPEWAHQAVPKTLQRRLLEPFGVVKGLQKVTVVGECYESIDKAMREKMEEPTKPAEDCLEEAEALKEEGNKLMGAKKYREAIKKYEESFFAMHILVIGRRRSVWADAYFDVDIRNGPNQGQNGHIVRLTLRIRLVANIILAYLNIENYEDAHFWGMRTINLMGEVAPGEPPNFPASKEIGKIYYRTAKAAGALMDWRNAHKLYRIALQYLPADRSTIEANIIEAYEHWHRKEEQDELWR